MNNENHRRRSTRRVTVGSALGLMTAATIVAVAQPAAAGFEYDIAGCHVEALVPEGFAAYNCPPFTGAQVLHGCWVLGVYVGSLAIAIDSHGHVHTSGGC